MQVVRRVRVQANGTAGLVFLHSSVVVAIHGTAGLVFLQMEFGGMSEQVNLAKINKMKSGCQILWGGGYS